MSGSDTGAGVSVWPASGFGEAPTLRSRRPATSAPARLEPAAEPRPAAGRSTGTVPPPAAAPAAAAHFRIEWAGLLAVLFCVGLVLVGSLWKTRDAADAGERARLDVQARVVDENVAQVLDGIARALASARDEALGGGTTPAATTAAMAIRLKALADAIPGVRSMILLDADGNVAATSAGALAGRDYSDREYFRSARQRRDPATLHVAAPYKTSLGNYTVVFSRAMVGADGRFAGVVAAALEPQYFEVLMRSVLYAPDMWVSLGHADGKVFVTMPRDPARLESDWQGGMPIRTRAGAGGSAAQTVRGPLAAGGEDRLTALRELTSETLQMDKPLVIAVSRSEGEVFRDWRRQAMEYALFYLVVCAVAAFGLQRGHARRLAFERLEASAAADRQTHALQLELALQSADIGLWNWDLGSDRLVHNPLSKSLPFGFSAEDLDDPSFDWRHRIHIADLGRIMAAVEAHLRGDATVFEAEFRIRHRDRSWIWLGARGRIVERDGYGVPLVMAGTHMDITARKSAEARIARGAEMLRRTGELADIGGWELDLATHRLDWTDQVFRIHGLPPGEMPSVDQASSFYAPEAQPTIAGAIEAGARDGTPWDLELPFVTAAGEARWVRTQGVAVLEDGKPIRLLGAFQDITERKHIALELHRANEQLQRLSTTDALTEVGNRRLFDQTLRAEWARAARRGEPIGLLMIDIDHFKEYNDHYGHPAGDACLRQVARMVGEAMRRGGELVARYGGEEFALLLPGATLAETLAAAERCARLLAEAKIEHRASPMSAWVTISIGAASQAASAGVESSTLVDIADAALYRAKRCGRGRIES